MKVLKYGDVDMNLSKHTKILLYIIIALTVITSAVAYIGVLLAFMLVIYEDKMGIIAKYFSKNLPVTLLCISLLISTVFSKEPIFSVATDIVILLHIIFCLILIVELNVQSYKSLYKLLSIICFAVCVFGIYQFLSGDMGGIKSWVDQKSFGKLNRIYSTLQNPNVFAGYIVINLCFFISKYLQKLNDKDKLLLPNIILLSACLILTYSRGGFISFCAAMFFLFLFRRDKRLAVYVAVMIGCFYLYNSLGTINRADIEVIYKDSSNTYRIEIWKSAIKIFLENPFWGHGVGTLWYYLSSYSTKLSKYVLHAHNIFLHVAAEMGIIGLLASFYFVVSEMLTAFTLWLRNKESDDSHIFLGFMCSLAAIMTHGMFDAVIFIPSLSIIYINYFVLYKITSYKYISSFTPVKANYFNTLPL